MNIVEGGLNFICAFQFDFGWREKLWELLHPIKRLTYQTPQLFWTPFTALRNTFNSKGSISPPQNAGQEMDTSNTQSMVLSPTFVF